MTDQLCNCHCGTRIDLDEQLLQQRQTWKQKYLCLKKQTTADIQALKQSIYQQCSQLMVHKIYYSQQQQFTDKQKQHAQIVNNKNIQIKDLISKCINHQTRIKVLEKQKQLLNGRIQQIAAELQQRDSQLRVVSNQVRKIQRQWQSKYQNGIAELRKRISIGNKEQIQKIEIQKEHLKHKVKQFQNKYQKIIPQVQKIKNALQVKTAQVQQMNENSIKIRKTYEQKLVTAKQNYQDLQKLHLTCPKHLKNLQSKKQSLQQQLQKYKKMNRQVRVQPVYIDRPVQVQKVIEKVVQVQRIVKKFINNPNNDKLQQAQQQNKRLRVQLNNVLLQIKQIQQHYGQVVQNLEGSIKLHEQNAIKYKKQRQNLAHRISEQNREMEMMEGFIEKYGNNGGQKKHQAEKIVVHVKQDGTYQKHTEKVTQQQPTISQQQSRRKK